MRWRTPKKISSEGTEALAGFQPLVSQLLWNRGVRTQEQAEIFLHPNWERDTFDPALFLQMPRAVARVFDAIGEGEMITVHGDYDADGVCGSTVLLSTLKEIAVRLKLSEAKFSTFIPHREKEGYGLSSATVDHLHAHEKTNVIITVDCGISNNEAITHAHSLGIDTIVCDHHAMPAILPSDAILIHPQVPGETYPNKKLCGTGVAFKLACALLREARVRGADFPEGHEKWLLDVVAIATVTDMVPLTGENRTLETFGLKVLNKTRRVGLQAVIAGMGSQTGELNAHSIGFQLGPRINAAGRMNHANEALYLLLEEDEAKARDRALHLNVTNIERQKATAEMYAQAKQLIGQQPSDSLIVVAQEGWGAGLVGLVAGKLLRDYGRPVLVVGRDGEKFLGSGRSIEGVDIVAALRAASDYLDRFGGHPQACGFGTLGAERFACAVVAMRENIAQQLGERVPEPELLIDAEVTLSDLTWKLFDAVSEFAPFGMENSIPVFTLKHAQVRSFQAVGGQGTHLRLTLKDETGKMFNMIGFGFGSFAAQLHTGDRLDVAFELSENRWNGNRELQGHLLDLKL